MKIVGGTGLGGLWALEWAWYIRATNLRCVQDYGIWTWNPSSLSLIVSEISAFIFTIFFQFLGVAYFFLGHSIGINENTTFPLKFVFQS